MIIKSNINHIKLIWKRNGTSRNYKIHVSGLKFCCLYHETVFHLDYNFSGLVRTQVELSFRVSVATDRDENMYL